MLSPQQLLASVQALSESDRKAFASLFSSLLAPNASSGASSGLVSIASSGESKTIHTGMCFLSRKLRFARGFRIIFRSSREILFSVACIIPWFVAEPGDSRVHESTALSVSDGEHRLSNVVPFLGDSSTLCVFVDDLGQHKQQQQQQAGSDAAASSDASSLVPIGACCCERCRLRTHGSGLIWCRQLFQRQVQAADDAQAARSSVGLPGRRNRQPQNRPVA